MKTTLSAILIFLLSLTIVYVPDTFAQDFPQYNLPTGAVASFGKGVVIEVAYSPDGTRLAIATRMGVWIHDAQTREELDMLAGHPGGISDIAYSPDGRVLACATGGEVWLWDTISGQLETPIIGLGEMNGVEKVAFSPDGTTFASSSRDTTVRLWDTINWQLKTEFGHTSGIKSIAFSPDGTTLAIGGIDKTVRLWNVATEQRRATLTGHTSWIWSIAFSPDGTTLAIGSSDGIHLWDAVSGQLKTILTGHSRAWVLSVAFSPDGATLASSGSDKTVRLWDIATEQRSATLTGHTGLIWSVTFSPDGSTLASGSNEIHLWNTASGQLRMNLTDYTSRVDSLAFSPDGQTLASGSQDGTGVRLWDVATGQSKAILSHTDMVRSIAFSPDSTTLAIASARGIIDLLDVATGRRRATLTGNMGSVMSVAFSPDGTTLASGNGDKTVRLWDVATGQSKATLTGHTGWVTTVAFSPDGTTLASGSVDETVRLWDVATGQSKATLTGHTGWVTTVAFSPDGTTLASGSMKIRLWEAATGQHKATIERLTGQGLVSAVFSPDGQTLASHDTHGGMVALWDVVSGHQKSTFPVQSNSVLSVAFSPDGRTLASGNQEGVVFLWKLTPALSQQDHPMVRLIYFRPNDRAPVPNIDATLDTLIKETQEFFAEQMENHGFGRKTFTFETDASGTAVVHHIEGQLSLADYLNYNTFKIKEELEQQLLEGDYIYLVALDISLEGMLTGRCGVALTQTFFPVGENTHQQALGGFAIIPGAGECFNVRNAAHEIGHTAGLSHDFRDDAYLMSYGTQDRLSYWAAQWLDAHPCWNPGQPRFNTLTTIEVLSTHASRLRFHVTDADGLQQAQLVVKETLDPTFVCGFRETLQNSQVLEGGTSSTFEFAVPSAITEGTLKVLDAHGSIAIERFSITPDETTVTDEDTSMDVNGDGVVDEADVIFIASRLGQPGQDNPADVNGNGIVDAADIMLIAGVLAEAAAAPATYPQVLEMFTTTDIQQWLTQAQQLNLTDATSQRGIRFLQHLLTMVIPKETALLPNYPNPFNPETWIPYQLAAPAEVTVSIYAADGRLIRTLALGQLPAGRYENQSRAAYWDGRNALGERVASGVYLYTLSAGNFTTTRKMLIRK